VGFREAENVFRKGDANIGLIGASLATCKDNFRMGGRFIARRGARNPCDIQAPNVLTECRCIRRG